MTVRELKSTWENLGRTDPLWAVLSDPARRNGGWDLDEFMTTGRNEVRVVTDLLDQHGLSLGDRVLDFGCGVGRLSNALAERVSSVVGIDIAASMIEQARALNQHPDTLEFVSYDGHPLPFPDDSFDSAVSLIVLQHARPAVQLASVLELLRVVRPGGTLVLQIPSHPKQPHALPADAARAEIELVSVPATLAANETTTVRARVTNRSEHTWPVGHLVKLGNHWWRDDRMIVQDDGRADLPHDVLPGDSCELDMLIAAPSTPGPAHLELDMMQEFVSWWADGGSPTARADVTVTEAVASDPEPEAAVEVIEEPAAAVVSGGTMEMHGLHTTLVRSVFSHCGATVLGAVPDTLAGPEWESYTYLVRLDG